MRQAFQGIKIDADSMVTGQIRKQPEINRRTNYMSDVPIPRIRDNIGNSSKSYKRPRSLTKETTRDEKKLHWTIRPCSSPADNWFVCEKSVNVAKNQNIKFYTKLNTKSKSKNKPRQTEKKAESGK